MKSNNHRKPCARKLHLSFSVDWEGENFSGLKDLARARSKIESAMRREIPLTHFICPAYYTNGEARATNRIRSVYRDGLDEVACHVHCWKSIVEAARVRFRAEHDWHANTARAGSGHGVPLGTYGDDIPTLLNFTKRLLEHELEVDSITSYRGGGGTTNDLVFDALTQAGIQVDSSACPPALLSKGYSLEGDGNYLDGFGEENGLLTTYKMALWGRDLQTDSSFSNAYQRAALDGNIVTGITQPYEVRTGDGSSLIELPMSGGISDYVDVNKTVWPTFVHLLKQVRSGKGPAFYHFGCHQEGEEKYKRPFVEFFQKLARYLHRDPRAQKYIVFQTVEQSGLVAEALLKPTKIN